MKHPIGFIKTYPKQIILSEQTTPKVLHPQNETMIILAGPVIGCTHEMEEDDDQD